MNNDSNKSFKTTTDSHGRIITYTEPYTSIEKIAFENCDFITLPKNDAVILSTFLKEYVNSRSGDTAIELGVDVGLSFERMIDRLNGFIYPNYKNLQTDSNETEIKKIVTIPNKKVYEWLLMMIKEDKDVDDIELSKGLSNLLEQLTL